MPHCLMHSLAYFNPRSPHGERRFREQFFPAAHTFQSTLPARGATLLTEYNTVTGLISIHAPRTGSDNTPELQGVQP